LHLALLGVGLGPGDEVIVPTLTYVASVNSIRYTGATPVFVDCEHRAWQLDPDDLQRRITPRTRAIMPVHLYGHPCDMDVIMSIARQHNLLVVEDCAEAFGTLYKGHHVGTYGDVATFSFYGNKTITCGEGGMVVSNRSDVAERVFHLKGQGVDPNRTYWHDVVGYNYRMTNIAAAIGLAQLERAGTIIEAKLRLARRYDRALSGLSVTTHQPLGDVRHTYWMYSVLMPQGVPRDVIMLSLAKDGIETRPFFYPAHLLPMYLGKAQSFPVAENLSQRGINLPSWPGLTETDIERIAEALRAALRAEADC
jgi:perosamine synthetase